MHLKSHQHNVLIFDSGVGGLSIYREIKTVMPDLRVTYASDNGYFPYGLKAEDDLIGRVEAVLRRLIDRFDSEAVVVACNTASTVVLPLIRTHFKIPVIGVVPAIKPAAQISCNKIIGLLATPGTVQRPYTDELIRNFAAECTVHRVGSSVLVQMVEDWMAGGAIDRLELQKILQPFFADPSKIPDTIVLGCTHFPLIKDQLAALAPQGVRWIDSGAAIALRLKEILDGLPPSMQHNGNMTEQTAVFTARTASAQKLEPVLRQMGFAQIDYLLS